MQRSQVDIVVRFGQELSHGATVPALSAPTGPETGQPVAVPGERRPPEPAGAETGPAEGRDRLGRWPTAFGLAP